MTTEEKILNFLKDKKYSEAAETFRYTPIFNYYSKEPLIKYEFFEFSKKTRKNPIFLRILLNYISLINLLDNLHLEKFLEILLTFGCKITYENLDNNFIKLILMVKSSTEVYDIFFKKGMDIFENMKENLVDIDDKEEDIKGIGYAYQELAKIFVNDYIIGTEKGTELPNILFYMNSTQETQKFLDKIIKSQNKLKLNTSENITDKKGFNEFDHIIQMKQDLTINKNNPYFRYIKKVNFNENNSPIQYGDLALRKNEIYILEFKNSFTMNDDIAKIEAHAKNYVKFYNTDITQIENTNQENEFKILYFYNNQENLGYRNISGYNITIDLWRFLYMNPSCQIVPVVNLSSEIYQLNKDNSNIKKEITTLNATIKLLTNENTSLKGEIATLKGEITSLKEENLLLKEEIKGNKLIFDYQISQFNLKWKEKFGEEIIQKEDERYLQIEIENSFKEKMSPITKIDELNSLDALFKKFEKGMNEFININEIDKLEIDPKNDIWRKKLTKELDDNDFKLCFEVLAPCIGNNKSSVNFFIIQQYFYNKTKKNDEMSEIYKYIYSSLFGKRKIKSKASIEIFYKYATKKEANLLIDIIKYTFYYDKKRKGKQYYLLTLLKHLVKKGNTEIHETMFNLRHKTLFELIFMTIVLFNLDNSNLRHGFEYFPQL